MESNFLFNQTVILVLGIALIAGLVYWMWSLSKKYKDMDIGEVLVTMAVDKNETIFVMLIAGLFITQAILAASLSNPDEPPLSPLARIGSHALISIGGLLASITLVRDIAAIFIPKIPPGERAMRIVMCLSLLVVALISPYLNLYLGASAAGKSFEFEVWQYAVTHSDTEYQSYLIRSGQPPTVRASSLLPTAIKIMLVEIFIHYMYTLVEGLRNVVSKRRRNMLFEKVYRDLGIDKNGKPLEDKPKTDVNSDPMPAQERQMEQMKKNFSFLLARINRNYRGDKLTNLVTMADTRVKSISDQPTRFAMAARAAQLAVRAKTIDSSSSDDKATQRAALVVDIRKFFESPNENSLKVEERGLGIELEKN